MKYVDNFFRKLKKQDDGKLSKLDIWCKNKGINKNAGLKAIYFLIFITSSIIHFSLYDKISLLIMFYSSALCFLSFEVKERY